MNERLKQGTPGVLLVMSAPSGAGKTSIGQRILEMFPQLHFSISSTTRPRRPGEVDGRDYEFLPEPEFRRRIAAGDFVEWVENYGNLYGTSRKQLEPFLAHGADLLLDIEPRGAKAIRAYYPQAVLVFILPPSLADLRSRLEKRGESPMVMEQRLQRSLDEIREALCYDYLIFNERLPEAVERFRAIYLAEKSRRERCAGQLTAFLT
ncbi:MAG: guanylate kinase [Syntrophaceae bacterium]|nr:guanylate kinase [Syntrophaceae bacterium]